MEVALKSVAAIVPCRINEVNLRSPIISKTCALNPSALSLPSLLNISKCTPNDYQGLHSTKISLFPITPSLLCWKSNSLIGSTRGLSCISFVPRSRIKRRNFKTMVKKDHQDDDPKGDFSYRRSSAPNQGKCNQELIHESGYEIKVSKEMMGVFQYVEKVKRARLRELSATLQQVAGACLVFSFIKGFIVPLVEVFKTDPPNWGKLIMFLGAFDAFAISYMAIKAREPLDKLSALATEFSSEDQMMGSIEKEEELMLALAMELLGLFGRLCYITLVTAVAQLAHIIHALLQVRGIQSNLPEYLANFIASWLGTPWA